MVTAFGVYPCCFDWVQKLVKSGVNMTQAVRKILFANSWSMSDTESPALWHQYARESKGVAIQSTYQRLVDCFNGTDLEVHIGSVRYVDYGTDLVPDKYIFTPALHKRKAFEHERELRALIVKAPHRPDGSTLDMETAEKVKGIDVPVDLGTLAERIFVSPDSPDWFLFLVKEATARLGLPDKDVSRSRLADKPTF